MMFYRHLLKVRDPFESLVVLGMASDRPVIGLMLQKKLNVTSM